VKITVFDANTDLQVTVVESNKDGKVQINLALGTSYRLEFIHKDKKVEKTVELQSGSSVQELEVKF
jgi:hypothetical protein